MYDLSQNGYTDRQIKKLLKENRQISFECDLLNSQEKYVKTLHSIKETFRSMPERRLWERRRFRWRKKRHRDKSG